MGYDGGMFQAARRGETIMQNSASILMYLRPTRLVFVRGIGPYEKTIQKTWDRLFVWLNANGLQTPVGRGYGLAQDNPAEVGAKNCRYDACVVLNPEMEQRASSDVGFAMLPGGPYACRRISGNYDHVRTLVANVHSELLPFPGLTLDQARPVVSIYMDNPNRQAESDLRADICMPVMAAEDVANSRAFGTA